MKRVLNFLIAYAAALGLLLTPAYGQVAVDTTKTGTTKAATLLCASAVAASLTGTLVETALATCTIPAGAMGLNGGLLIIPSYTVTNSVNNKTLRARLGGIGGTAYMGVAVTTIATLQEWRHIRNRNSASSQVAGTSSGAGNAIGSTTAAITTGAVDTTVAQDLVLTGQLALNTETITLESYEVWLLP